jgi:GNAT superfamily N-acetyltransferase
MARRNPTLEVHFHAATPERWQDVEKLFGARGACGGCWCMWWRLPRSEFEQGKGEGNKKAFRQLVKRGRTPGLLAYVGEEPVGWCAVAPREQYPRFERSRVLKPVDEQPVWSVTCFFVAKAYRGKGLIKLLLGAAVDYAREQGAKIVEGYPVELQGKHLPDPFVYTGLASSYRAAGFQEVARRSATRPIMRYLC